MYLGFSSVSLTARLCPRLPLGSHVTVHCHSSSAPLAEMVFPLPWVAALDCHVLRDVPSLGVLVFITLKGIPCSSVTSGSLLSSQLLTADTD